MDAQTLKILWQYHFSRKSILKMIKNNVYLPRKEMLVDKF